MRGVNVIEVKIISLTADILATVERKESRVRLCCSVPRLLQKAYRDVGKGVWRSIDGVLRPALENCQQQHSEAWNTALSGRVVP